MMQTSIEISYYPMQEEFIPSILEFVHRLKSYSNIQVVSTSMSTQIFGEYDELMAIITKEIKKSMDIPHSVFILKIINSDLQIHPNNFIDE
jgi:uncharacterized protein YqgV (UPF0045/DUF77 family)